MEGGKGKENRMRKEGRRRRRKKEGKVEIIS